MATVTWTSYLAHRSLSESVWFENTDKANRFQRPNLIANADSVWFVGAHDIEGDGDADIVFGDQNGLSWMENLDSGANFGPRRSILNLEARSIITFGDVDADGDLDLFTMNEREGNVYIHENKFEGTFGSPREIVAVDGGGGGFVTSGSLRLGDIDGDGDLDILYAFARFGFVGGTSRFAWYENVDGTGNFGPGHDLTQQNPGAFTTARLMDFDSDDDLDIVYSAPNSLNWLENLGGGTLVQRFMAVPEFDRVITWTLEDLNGDEDLDLIAVTKKDTVAWYEHAERGATFQRPRIITNDVDSVQSVLAVDLDGDGDREMVTASSGDDRIAWYDNDGNGSFGSQAPITSTGAVGAALGDVDGDGDLDLVTRLVETGEAVWYENTEGQVKFETTHRISQTKHLPTLADLDGDGDLDVLTSETTGTGWHRNTGNGNFVRQSIISSGTSATLGDIDGDGDLDLVNREGSAISWHENRTGDWRIVQKHVISGHVPNPRVLGLADLDGDGDVDLLASRTSSQGGPPPKFELVWYENVDGGGSFGIQKRIATVDDFPPTLLTGDLDADGDEDFVVVTDSILVFENADGKGQFRRKSTIGLARHRSVTTLADLDGDGHLDIVSGLSESGALVWNKNAAGRGAFGHEQTIEADMGWINDISVGDLDNDGDADIVSSVRNDKRITWHESDLADPDDLPGDANRDGTVDFLDFVRLSVNFGRSVDAVWEDGDFDKNSAVDFADFVILSLSFGTKR